MDGNGHGITYRSVNYLFDLIDNKSNVSENDIDNSFMEFTIGCSYLEIYMERIQDLLDPALNYFNGTGHTLNFKNSPDGRGVFVEGCHVQYVSCPEEVFFLLEIGRKNRQTKGTKNNERSSRSHSIFVVQLSSKNMRTGFFHFICQNILSF